MKDAGLGRPGRVGCSWPCASLAGAVFVALVRVRGADRERSDDDVTDATARATNCCACTARCCSSAGARSSWRGRTSAAWSTAPATPTSARKPSRSASAPTCGRDDVVFSTHRGHGHALAKGVPPLQLIAELFGRADRLLARPRRQHAPVRARSRHDGHQRHRRPVHPAGGRRRLQLPAAEDGPRRGRVLRRRRGEQRRVPRGAEPGRASGSCRCCSSARTTSSPPRCRSRTPPATRASPAAARPTACPGIEVDGNDVLAVHEAAGEAVERARAGDGPTLLECKTYRTRPHAEGMGDFTYRTREEVEAGRRAARSSALRAHARRAATATEARARRASTPRSQREVEEAHRAAEASPVARPGDGRDARLRRAAARRQRRRRPASARSSPSCRRRSKRWPPRWPRTRRSSCSARASASAAATSRPRPACSTCTAPSGCATRRSASAASSAWRAARP